MLLRNLEHAYKSKANLSRNWECTKGFDGSYINLSFIGRYSFLKKKRKLRKYTVLSKMIHKDLISSFRYTVYSMYFIRKEHFLKVQSKSDRKLKLFPFWCRADICASYFYVFLWNPLHFSFHLRKGKGSK